MNARTTFWTTLLQPPRAMRFPFTLGTSGTFENLLTGPGFALEFWVYVEAYTNPPRESGWTYTGSESRQLLVLARGSEGYSFLCALAEQRLQFYSYNNQSVQTQAALPAKTWHHVAIALAEGTVCVYLNGQPAPLQGQQGHQAPMSPLRPISGWGLGHNDGHRTNEALYGQLDELRFWNTTRSEDQINAAYQLSNSDLLLRGTPGLMACYDFNEQPPAAFPLRDGSGQGLHLYASTNGWENSSVPSTAPLLR